MLKIVLFVFLFSSGTEYSKGFTKEDIKYKETSDSISLFANTTECPQVHVQKFHVDLIRTKFNHCMTWLRFKSEIKWPWEISIDLQGSVDINFLKRNLKAWNKKSAPVFKELKDKDNPLANNFPDYWKMKVMNLQWVTYDTCLLSIKYVGDVYNHIGVGQHLTIRHIFINGSMSKSQYTPVPMMPIWNLNSPNPAPGQPKITGEMIHFLIKANHGLSKWLCNRLVGHPTYISYPQGSFCPSVELQGKKKVYLIASGIGIAPLLSVILWVLQTSNDTTVHLLFFNRHEKDIIWRKELEKINTIDSRFQVEFSLTKPSEFWTGRKGKISLDMIKSLYPPYGDSMSNFFGVCGQHAFSNQTKKWLMEDMGYPEKDVYTFLGQ